MPVIRTRSLIPIIEIIRRYDLAPEEVIAPLGIEISFLTHPKYEDPLELHKAYDLLEVVAEITGCYFLGALIGREEKLSLLGPIAVRLITLFKKQSKAPQHTS